MTVQEVASLMRTSTETVRRHLKSGELVSVRFGALLRVRRSDLSEYLNRTAERA